MKDIVIPNYSIMLTRKWMRAIIVVVIVYALTKICLRMRQKHSKSGLDRDFKFATLVREKSGAKKRIPPDANYTDTDDITREDVRSHGNLRNESINASDTWRARKFIDPGAFDRKVSDPEMEATIWMEATNHSAPQIEELRALFKKKWTASRDGVLEFRKQLEEFKSSMADAILTQNNTKVGQQVRYSLNRDAFANITQEMFDFLPRESPFAKLRLPRCSVVGNSGILIGNVCGDQIDDADFIFRCNVPLMKGFEMDVGKKSNFTTINAVSTLKYRYHFMQTKSDSMKFIRDVQRFYGYFWMSIFGLKSGLSYNLRVAREVRKKKELPNLRLIISHPDHFSAVQDFWTTKFMSTRISTGLYLVTLALSLCDETHLYGFWPFPLDLNLRPTRYHYYDKLEGPTSVHSFTDEFRAMMGMHRDGLLRLHVDRCT